MSTYLLNTSQEAHKFNVPQYHIHLALAQCIANDVQEFKVMDDRGGTGCWVLFLPAKLSMAQARRIAGKEAERLPNHREEFF